MANAELTLAWAMSCHVLLSRANLCTSMDRKGQCLLESIMFFNAGNTDSEHRGSSPKSNFISASRQIRSNGQLSPHRAPPSGASCCPRWWIPEARSLARGSRLRRGWRESGAHVARGVEALGRWTNNISSSEIDSLCRSRGEANNMVRSK